MVWEAALRHATLNPNPRTLVASLGEGVVREGGGRSPFFSVAQPGAPLPSKTTRESHSPHSLPAQVRQLDRRHAHQRRPRLLHGRLHHGLPRPGGGGATSCRSMGWVLLLVCLLP